MKAISLWQPWASLVACGAKRFETRSWPTRYRGPLLIHAAKKVVPSDVIAAILDRKFLTGAVSDERACIDRAMHDLGAPQGSERECTLSSEFCRALRDVEQPLPHGVLLAVVELVDCRPAAEVALHVCDQERACGDFGPGRFAWELAGVQALALPIPFRGAQRLFEVPDDVLQRALQLRASA